MPVTRIARGQAISARRIAQRGAALLACALFLTVSGDVSGQAQRASTATRRASASSSHDDRPMLRLVQREPPPPPQPPVEPPPESELTLDPRRIGEPAPPGASSDRQRIPLIGLEAEEKIDITGQGGRISLIVRQAPLHRVLEVLAQRQGLNIVITEDASTQVSITLRDVPVQAALTAVLSVSGHTWVERNGIIHVSPVSGASSLAPEVQGRQLRVFELDYASAEELEPVVRGMLSPVGKAFINSSSPADNRKTKEVLIVEDLPTFLRRIEMYVAQVDRPPRQVLIEARVMAVELADDNRHGVNWDLVTQLGGVSIHLQSLGFASSTSSPATLATFDTGNLNSLIEALKSTTDIKTLAAPKVLVLNGQEARIQVGEQLGFRVTTTTETSTLENVNFLDVGVVLRVIPRITRDGGVLMHVKPEVSSGEVNPITGLPEEETTEIETDVLLDDGLGVVIGGLIQEKLNDTQSKKPWLGDHWMVGRFFQKRQYDKSRTEIIIALIPHVVRAGGESPRVQERVQAERAFTPILHGPLCRVPRPWEPSLHDAVYNPTMFGYHLRRLPPPPPMGHGMGDCYGAWPCQGAPYNPSQQVPHGREEFFVPVEPDAAAEEVVPPPPSRDPRFGLLPPVREGRY